MPDTMNGPKLHPDTLALASAPNFAAMTTVFPSGQLQTQYVWVHPDGERLVVNTEVHRAKHRNLQRDSRVTLLIRDEDDPYHYAEVRGTVSDTATGPRAREHIDEMAHKYIDAPYPAENIKSERVMIWVTPERQTVIDQKRTGEPE